MIGFLLLILTALLGYGLAWRLPGRFSHLERLAAAFPVGILLTSWVSLGLAWVFPWRISFPLIILVVGAATLIFFPRGIRHFNSGLPSSRAARLGWGCLLTALGGLFAYLLWNHMAWVRPDGWYSVGGSWGDVPLHLSLISSFTFQEHFSWSFPLLYGTKLTYPFLIDLYSALLYRGGMTPQWALILPGLLLFLSFLQLVISLSLRYFGRFRGIPITLFLLVFNGSPAGIAVAIREWQGSNLPLGTFLRSLPKEYTNLPSQHLDFANFITTHLLPQRSILLGAALFGVILLFWQEDSSRPSRLPYLTGILLGLLPLAHFHTFAVTFALLVWLVGVKWIQNRQPDLRWLSSLGIALLLAAPQLIWQLLSQSHVSTIHLQLGWMRAPGENLFLFWWRNMGPEVILLFLVTGWLYRLDRQDKEGRVVLYLPFLLLFLLANILAFQPSNFDNMKLFFYVHLMFCLMGGAWIADWLSRGWWQRLVGIGVVLSLTVTGVLGIWQELGTSFLLFSNADLAFAREVRQVTPASARILTSDQHNHPVSALTGRSIVMGYSGWLWSYGLPYEPVSADVLTMYAGGEPAEKLIDRYGVSYVAITASELSQDRANLEYFMATYPVVAYEDGRWLFKVR